MKRFYVDINIKVFNNTRVYSQPFNNLQSRHGFYQVYFREAILITCLLAISPAVLPAADGSTNELLVDNSQIPTLEQITVVGKTEDQVSGQSQLSSETLQSLPKKNSSIVEAITLLPRVQIGEEQTTSRNAGEILPPLISISGARAYENYFSVDNVGQSSLLDPLADNPNDLDGVPGHPLRAFIHQDLVESVTVYDSNIPARYGRFVGGVVEARTRMPASEFGGNFSLRTTKDSWTHFKIDEEDREDFNNSDDFSNQPRFTKYDGGIEFDIPVNEELGLLASYKRIESDLELQHFGDWDTKSKTLETFFIKSVWKPQTSNMLELAVSYTPSEEDFFLNDVKDSGFSIKRGGYTLNGIMSGETSIGTYEVSAAFLESTNTREAPNNLYTWEITPAKDWGATVGTSTSREGGFGDIENSERSLQLHADLFPRQFSTGDLTHIVNVGFHYSRDYGEYNRKETTYTHSGATLNSAVICAAGDPACAGEEQYFDRRNVFPAQKEDASLNYFSGYLEDLITVGPVELRPGVRISHDDFMKNTNTAHRLAGSWDIFSNGETILVGGHNRYYGETLLTYKLREAIEPFFREERTLDPETSRLSEWVFDRDFSVTLNKYSELDTPFSDEWNIGIKQKLFGGTLELNYLERDHKDQFARERITELDGTRYYILNNNGSSQYESVKAMWERQWQDHYININYTYTDQIASNESYDDDFDEEDLDEKVWYDGDIIFIDELPRADFYRKHALAVIYTGRLPYGFTFTNIAKYLGNYEAINSVKMSDEDKIAAGIPVELDIYAKEKRPDYWIVDWRLDWEKAWNTDQALVLTFEINNVFNRTPPAGESISTYELGRQFWLGMTYKF